METNLYILLGEYSSIVNAISARLKELLALEVDHEYDIRAYLELKSSILSKMEYLLDKINGLPKIGKSKEVTKGDVNESVQENRG